MKLKSKPTDTKTMRTIVFLTNKEQFGLAFRLLRIEFIRIHLAKRQAKLNSKKDKNRARWNDLAIDIDHFILMNQEKGY